MVLLCESRREGVGRKMKRCSLVLVVCVERIRTAHSSAHRLVPLLVSSSCFASRLLPLLLACLVPRPSPSFRSLISSRFSSRFIVLSCVSPSSPCLLVYFAIIVSSRLVLLLVLRLVPYSSFRCLVLVRHSTAGCGRQFIFLS